MSAVEAYVPDQLWEITTPLIPPAPRRRQGGGRRRLPDRADPGRPRQARKQNPSLGGPDRAAPDRADRAALGAHPRRRAPARTPVGLPGPDPLAPRAAPQPAVDGRPSCPPTRPTTTSTS